MLDKKSLSERDICTKFITPAIEKAGWDKLIQLLEKSNVSLSVTKIETIKVIIPPIEKQMEL